jgi:hypothetical protein
MLSRSVRLLISTLVIVGTVSGIAQQTAPGKHLSPFEVRTLLRSPNGLEKAADLTGNFTLERELHIFVDPSLSDLLGASSTVVVGTLVFSESRLSEDGDTVYTNYHFTPEIALKSANLSSSEITVTSEGGKVQFRNGSTAEIKTIEWTHLKAGNKYLLCLNQRGDKFHFTIGFAGIFELHAGVSSEAQVIPLASFSHCPYRVLKDAELHTPDSFVTTVRQKIAERQP